MPEESSVDATLRLQREMLEVTKSLYQEKYEMLKDDYREAKKDHKDELKELKREQSEALARAEKRIAKLEEALEDAKSGAVVPDEIQELNDAIRREGMKALKSGGKTGWEGVAETAMEKMPDAIDKLQGLVKVAGETEVAPPQNVRRRRPRRDRSSKRGRGHGRDITNREPAKKQTLYSRFVKDHSNMPEWTHEYIRLAADHVGSQRDFDENEKLEWMSTSLQILGRLKQMVPYIRNIQTGEIHAILQRALTSQDAAAYMMKKYPNYVDEIIGMDVDTLLAYLVPYKNVEKFERNIAFLETEGSRNTMSEILDELVNLGSGDNQVE